MYCPKCGNELRDGATFCDRCGVKLSKAGKSKSLVVGIILIAVGIAAILVGVTTLLFSYVKNSKVSSSTVASVREVTQETTSVESPVSETPASVKEETVTEKIINVFSGEAKVELPSLVSFSKDRLSLGDYEEAKSCGGYVQYFEAGDDTSIINCIAEYKDILSSYDVTVTGTLSSNDGTYNYTCYTCSYTGSGDIELGTINFNGAGACDLCFVTASGDGKAYIAAYVPEGVTFTETGDQMKNSY